MTDHVLYAVDDNGIATITINRPEKRNAMTYAMGAEFRARVAEAGTDDHVRVLILTGSGGTFCAGIDLSDLKTADGQPRKPRDRSDEPDSWWPLTRCPKPVIAAIDGFAVGMGAELTTQCDVRIMTDRARIAWNFAKRGLVPDTAAGSWLLPRIIGPQRALRLLYSADFLEAEEALAIGYAAQVVAPEDLEAAARREATRYLSSSPFALARIKSLTWRGFERTLDEHMTAHVEAMTECFASQDHKEGVAAFMERREARFTGR